ncbi:hypothetical protein ALI144C_47145 [Actinosynnema sp. ALI-1.44]|uniref:glycosyltransferase family 87 protein n=1 Tax=Actinosynnema sp. ALI-1.44 TaxID=1933779 RepID=UPI00097C7DFE|nr:glycosyltransferase family 87 protein [Actinosynnema sp. ALI-1.44]ONI70257.1 hypothetical protein ALI144C_47145 [Actinosynnema sp. ALI-1.44]
MVGRVGALLGAVAAAGVTLWLLLTYGSSNIERVLATDMSWHPDFDTFHKSAIALVNGNPIYDTGATVVNLNPPFWSVLMAPFAPLDLLTAYRLFGVITVFLVLAGLLLVAWDLRAPYWTWWVVSAAVLASSPLLGTFALGQVYGVLAIGLALAWFLQRRGRPILAGIAFGLVIAIKPTLAPILLLPVVQRQWKTLQAAVAAGVVATLVGVLVAGPEETLRWWEVLRAEHLSTFLDNASLPSLVSRLGGPAWVGFVLGAAVLAFTLRRMRHDPDMGLWAVTAATLLFSPVAWHNYLVLCFPGVFVVLLRRRFATATLLLTMPLIGVEWGFYWQGDSLVDHIGQSLYFLVLLIYWAALTVKHDGDDPGEVRQPGHLRGAEHRPAWTADQ